jgi:vacuolar protein sorting-associated protein 54
MIEHSSKCFQDYKVHRDEIHLKLVQIMKERLMVHLRTFPQIVETWMRSEDNDAQPSQFARAVTKVHQSFAFLQQSLPVTNCEGLSVKLYV